MLTFQTSFKNSFQNKNKFQIFKLFTESLWSEGQSQKKREKSKKKRERGMMTIIV